MRKFLPIFGIIFVHLSVKDHCWDFFGIFKSRSISTGLGDFRDFAFGIFSAFSNPNPDPRDSGISEIFRSSPNFKIPIPGIRIRDPKKSHPELWLKPESSHILN